METGTAYVVTRSNDGAQEQFIFTHSYTKDASVFNNTTLAEWKHPTGQLTHSKHFIKITTNLHQLA
jgi:hypothetical protein